MNAHFLLSSFEKYRQKYQQKEKCLAKTNFKAVQSQALKGISYVALNWITSAPAASLSR